MSMEERPDLKSASAELAKSKVSAKDAEGQKRQKYHTKTVRFGEEQITLYSLDGFTWSTRRQELEQIKERLENQRVSFNPSKLPNKGKPAPGASSAAGVGAGEDEDSEGVEEDEEKIEADDEEDDDSDLPVKAKDAATGGGRKPGLAGKALAGKAVPKTNVKYGGKNPKTKSPASKITTPKSGAKIDPRAEAIKAKKSAPKGRSAKGQAASSKQKKKAA